MEWWQKSKSMQLWYENFSPLPFKVFPTYGKERVFYFFNFVLKPKIFQTVTLSKSFWEWKQATHFLKLIFESKQWSEISFPKKKDNNTQRQTKYLFNFLQKMVISNLKLWYIFFFWRDKSVKRKKNMEIWNLIRLVRDPIIRL